MLLFSTMESNSLNLIYSPLRKLMMCPLLICKVSTKLLLHSRNFMVYIYDMLLLAYIEDEQNTMATFEVCGYDCSILLLSGRVPDVEFSRFAFESDIFNSEINCGDLSALFRLKLALYKPPK